MLVKLTPVKPHGETVRLECLLWVFKAMRSLSEQCCSAFEGRDSRLTALSAHSSTYTCVSQYRTGIKNSKTQEKNSPG